ncbi:hypothetical protein HaLaN_32824 [Haematococcus lacustris]|uniref:Uncharacterized protein n=1 Tax=Haematococcus lacustris TaxID=44745 RepID=A0A6A0AKG1_HAELA|nr:hypothetical protein HaLaN_32824 [Haematococcus lacustris]
MVGQGLQCNAQHAAHCGQQVAPVGAVPVARAGSSASQGQGVPWPGLQALTISACFSCQLYTIALAVRQ